MTDVPFAGLSPAPDAGHARWVVESMQGRDGVTLVVPAGFEAYARVLHPLPDSRRWDAVAPEYLDAGDRPYRYPFPDDVAAADEGDPGPDVIDAIVPLLATATATPEHCHLGLWTGWGELHPVSRATTWSFVPAGRSPIAALWRRRVVHRILQRERAGYAPVDAFVAACALQPWWGGRDMLLFDGPIDRVAAIGTLDPFSPGLRRRGPQWWWPADRGWFVATEIDYPWTYVAGTHELVAAATTHPRLEAVPVDCDASW
jgi:hypothetical protein